MIVASRQGPGVVMAPPARPSLPRYQFSQSLTQKDMLPLGTAAPFSSTMLGSQQTPCDCISIASFSRHWGCQRGQRWGVESLVGKHSGEAQWECLPGWRASSFSEERHVMQEKGWNTPPSWTASSIQAVSRSVQAAVVETCLAPSS